ncbi:MAG: DUF484 family protein [Pseudomonadota bacterium]
MSDGQNLAQTPVTDESMVIDYLLANPDFFVTHADILTRLQIPHDSGSAVSLVERQIEIYREKSLRLEKQLKDLLDVARENERIGQLLHQFAVTLMHTQSSAAVIKATRQTIMRDFHTDQVTLTMFDNDSTMDDTYADMSPSRSVICGRLTAQQRAKLFENADNIASVALILLHTDGENLGVLAMGSQDRQRFHPSKGILFLSQLGNLVSQRLLTVK